MTRVLLVCAAVLLAGCPESRPATGDAGVTTDAGQVENVSSSSSISSSSRAMASSSRSTASSVDTASSAMASSSRIEAMSSSVMMAGASSSVDTESSSAAVSSSSLEPGCMDSDGDARGPGCSAGADNCPDVSNPAQRDDDHDGLGEACDPDDTKVVQVSAGRDHTCALKASGKVYCWGGNNDGLGDGVNTNSERPVLVAGIEDAVQIHARYFHTCALRASGHISCWGRNSEGQLGDGTTDSGMVPTNVRDIDNAVQLSCGFRHCCALLSTGSVACWGRNDSGQLGTGNRNPALVPVYPLGLDDVIHVAAGEYFTCAVRAGGQASCWGFMYDTLGDGVHQESLTAVDVSNSSDVVEIGCSGGQHGHACMRHVDNRVTCFGANDYFSLGTEAPESAPTPVAPALMTTGTVAQVGAGLFHSCVRLDDGHVHCWGVNGQGQVGDNTTETRPTPVQVVGLDDAVQISTGELTTCAVKRTGGVACWGYNVASQIGDGTYFQRNAPVDVVGLP